MTTLIDRILSVTGVCSYTNKLGGIFCYALDITHTNFQKNISIFSKIGMGNVGGITNNESTPAKPTTPSIKKVIVVLH